MKPGLNLVKAFNEVSDYWSPRIIAEVDDHYIKIAKVLGSFVWHAHELEDELFYIVKGSLLIEMEDEEDSVMLEEGDLYVVPKGKRHNPQTDEECWLMLIEKKSTRHTGDVDHPMTKPIDDQF